MPASRRRQIVFVIWACALLKSCLGTNLTELNVYTSSVSSANSNSFVDQTLTGNSILDLAYTTFNTSGILLAGALFLAASGFVAFQNLPPPPVVREQIRDFKSNPFGVIPPNAFSTAAPAQALRTEREVYTKIVPLEIAKQPEPQPQPQLQQQQPFEFVTSRPNIVNPFITSPPKVDFPKNSYYPPHIPVTQPTTTPHLFSYNDHGYDPEDYKDYKDYREDDHRSNELTRTRGVFDYNPADKAPSTRDVYEYNPADEANSIGFDPDVIDENKFVFDDYPTIKLTTSSPRPAGLPSTNYDLSNYFVREQAPPPPVPTSYVTRTKATDPPRTFSGHPISKVPGPPYHDTVPQSILKPMKTRQRPKKSLSLPTKKQTLLLKIPDKTGGNSLMGKITKAIKGTFNKAAKKPSYLQPQQPQRQKNAVFNNRRRELEQQMSAAKSQPDEIYDYYDDGQDDVYDDYENEYYYNGFESMRGANSMRKHAQVIPHLEREDNQLKRLSTVQLKDPYRNKGRLSSSKVESHSWRPQLPFAPQQHTFRTKVQQQNRDRYRVFR